jgi:hypothetical protein
VEAIVAIAGQIDAKTGFQPNPVSDNSRFSVHPQRPGFSSVCSFIRLMDLQFCAGLMAFP